MLLHFSLLQIGVGAVNDLVDVWHEPSQLGTHSTRLEKVSAAQPQTLKLFTFSFCGCKKIFKVMLLINTLV